MELTFWPLLAVGMLAAGPRQQVSGDFDWRFHLGETAGAEAVAFDDSGWRAVDLPHDWSIEGLPVKGNPSGAGAGFFPGGTGWYRKAFDAPAAWQGKRVSVEFGGVYMDATVYLNGQKLGTHVYGYTSFQFDLTGAVKPGARNVLAVRVNNAEQPNSRWYSGSGIYRHVQFVVTEPAHVDHWGVFVTTPSITAERAQTLVRTRVKNDGRTKAALTVRTLIRTPKGAVAAQGDQTAEVEPGAAAELKQELAVKAPELWAPEAPRLYTAVTQVLAAGKVVDEVVTRFGIRSLAWSATEGFRLNGKPIHFAGGSVHHDNGVLGAAAFDRAEERKVELLKAAGFNAVRTAHNPPSAAFLDACDRLGLLVLDEPFDVWKLKKVKYDYARFFDEWWPQDVDAMVLRDRNHPSVVIWGIGNEIPDAWMKDGAPLARQIAARVRQLDDTRPLTQAVPGATFTPNIDAVLAALDMAGYNYNLGTNSEADHKRVPSRLMVTTESLPADAFEQWSLTQAHPYIAGEFVWTAMDYLGESGIGAAHFVPEAQAKQAEQGMGRMKQMMSQMGADGKNPFEGFAAATEGGEMPAGVQLLFAGYPYHAAQCGDLDLTGWRKPQSYYRDLLWNGGDRVYAAVRIPPPAGQKALALGWAVIPIQASWNWPGHEGQPLEVEVYAGTEKVRLYLNGRLIGEKATTKAEQLKALFTVPYEAGELKAVGLKGGKAVAESMLKTTGAAHGLRLTADRRGIGADGEDLAYVTVEAVDEHGAVVPDAAASVKIALQGPGSIAGLGNGDGKSAGRYQGEELALYQGRGLVVLRAGRKAGALRLKAQSDGLQAAEVTVETKAIR